MPVPRGDLPTAGHRKATGAKGTRIIRLAQGRFAESMGLEMEELTMPGASQSAANAECMIATCSNGILPSPKLTGN